MTIIEVMIALAILLITSLAMMSTALMGMQTNMINSLRDEAVGIAEARMNELRNTPFPDLPAMNDLTATGGEAADSTINRRVRAASFTFTRKRTVADINADTKQVSLTVTWSYKTRPYTHSIMTILRRQS
jgi:type II secretory pathway pseudopilin PulG